MKPYQEHRPWGYFEILYEEAGLKIKRIVVQPGKRLSLQSHRNRSENWAIVKGKAIISIDQGKVHAFTGQSVFIPKEAKHRVENSGQENLEIVEVQTGEYLGEDDIIRYEDDFNRS